MKKIRSAEFLAAVAIITSAAVMQIREHVLNHEAASMAPPAALLSCGTSHDGLLVAACEATRGEAQAKPERSIRPLHRTSKIWV